MAPKPRFSEGEKVLCFHGPLLYEAKCLRFQVKDKHMKYFIHYSGWNKNWDEWVPECRIMKYNDQNLQKQQELTNTFMKSKKSKSLKAGINKKEPEKDKEKEPAPSASTTTTAVAVTPTEKTLKQKPEKKPAVSPTSDEIEIIEIPEPKKSKKVEKPELCFIEDPPQEMLIKIKIPREIEAWLVDDCDVIVRQKKILQLPARITIDHIVASYVKEKVSSKGLSPAAEATIVQISNRIRDCFNALLGNSLLYKFERPQYSEMLTDCPNLKMCEIYGAIHLIRMFTKFGEMLSSLSTPRHVMTKLIEHIEDFIKYIAMNPSFFSVKDYIVASPEYHRRAMT